jgi:aminoglycoside phosphotransferase (APT) family kinase protein
VLGRFAVRDYASEVMRCSPERITSVKRFEDGNRHAVSKVSYRDTADVARHVVVRVAYTADCAQPAREAAVLEQVGGVAAPRLYDFRCTSPWFDTPAMCMEFSPGRQAEMSSATLTEIERLGSVVAWVHAQPTGATGDLSSYAQGRLRSILSTLVWARDPLPEALQARLAKAADALATSFDGFEAGEPLALLHGDIAAGNVLWGDRGPVLIDWEYTRLGDPADEIAYLFDQNALSEPQRQAFWDGYRAGPQIRGRVAWWEPVTLLGSTLWWVERWVRRAAADPAVPREPGYYFDHVMRRLERLEKLIARP